jgi:hypothetical protein
MSLDKNALGQLWYVSLSIMITSIVGFINILNVGIQVKPLRSSIKVIAFFTSPIDAHKYLDSFGPFGSIAGQSSLLLGNDSRNGSCISFRFDDGFNLVVEPGLALTRLPGLRAIFAEENFNFFECLSTSLRDKSAK